MSSLLAVLAPIALINSMLTLPPRLAGVVASLSNRQPYLTAVAYIAGKFVPLLLFGLLLAIGLDTAFDQLKLTAQGVWRDPSWMLVTGQLLIGIGMLLLANRLLRTGQHPHEQTHSPHMPPLRVFSVVAGTTLLGLPGSILYFAAIDQILRADLAAVGIANAILFYNVIYLSPLILFVLVRWLFGVRADPLFNALTEFFNRWGIRLVSFAVSCLGGVFVADAVGWFAGVPLLPINIR